MGTAVLTSLEEFLADPEIDERRLELIDGEVYEKPMPTWGHGTLALEIGTALREHGFASVEPRAVIGAVASFDASSPIPDGKSCADFCAGFTAEQMECRQIHCILVPDQPDNDHCTHSLGIIQCL